MILNPLEAYVLMDVLSRPDRTMPVDTQHAAQVRAQLWVKLMAGFKAEFDQGIDRNDEESPYGPLTLLVFFGDGFGQKAFIDYAVGSGQWHKFFGMVPDALKGHVSAVARNVSPALSASPLGLLPLIGRPVYNFLIHFGVNPRLATGIAGFVEQGVLALITGGLAWLLGWIFGVGFVWGLIVSTAIIWKMFPKAHGGRVFVYEYMAGWRLKLVEMTADHLRSLRRASYLFFGSFLVITLVPVIAPLLGFAVPGSLEQWFFAGVSISSLFHGLRNSIHPFTTRVVALGGGHLAEFFPRNFGKMNHQNLIEIQRIFLGGEAGKIVPETMLTVSIDALRKRVADDRQSLVQERNAMLGSLGLGTDVSEETIAGALARGHGSSGDEKSIKRELELLLAPSLVGLDGETALNEAIGRITQIIDAYHVAQGLFDFEKALDAAIADQREIALELTISMIQGDLKHLTLAEKAQWDRLKRVAQAASKGDLQKRVHLVIPKGITQTEVETALTREGAGGLLHNISTKPKSELVLAEGKYSLRRFVDWVRGDKEGMSGPIEMYLMSRNDWDWDSLADEIRRDVRLLVDILPGLVMDATRGLPEGLKRIVVVNMSA